MREAQGNFRDGLIHVWMGLRYVMFVCVRVCCAIVVSCHAVFRARSSTLKNTTIMRHTRSSILKEFSSVESIQILVCVGQKIKIYYSCVRRIGNRGVWDAAKILQEKSAN